MAHIKRALGNGHVIVAWRDRNGVTRRVSTTRRAASAVIALDAAKDLPGEPGAAPLAAVLDALIAERPGISEVTRRNYVQFLRNAIEDTAMGDTDVWAVNAEVVERWVAEQVRQRRNARTVLHFLRVLLGYPVAAGLISMPPVDVRSIPLPGARALNTSDTLEPLSASEVWMLLDHVSVETAAFVHLLISGVEMRSAIAVDCTEIDTAIDSGVLTVADRLSPSTDASLEEHPHGPRTWALGALAIAALTEVQLQRSSHGTWRDGQLAFPGRDGVSPMSINGVTYRLRVAAQRAADVARATGDEAAAYRLERVSFSSLRATAAVLAHQGGASIYDIARQLGRSIGQVRLAYALWLEPQPAA